MRRPSHAHEPRGAAEAFDRERAEIVVFDRDAVRAVDRAATDEYGIPGIVLMENAARALCDQALSMLPPRNVRRNVLIICGPGNNGGDGYALARHLHNRGDVEVLVAALGQPKPDSDAGINRSTSEKLVPVVKLSDVVCAEKPIDPSRIDLIVDALLGTGLDRPVVGDAAAAIAWINGAERPVLAVDVPSGMDCNTGKPLGACVRATATVTFVGAKPGFLELDAQKLLGEVVVADIGAPRELLERFGRRIARASRPESPERGATSPATPMRRRD